MGKKCFYCGKPVGFLDADLQNGKLCDDCYWKAVKENGYITRMDISKYSGEEIRALINRDEEALSDSRNFAPHVSNTERAEEKIEHVMGRIEDWAWIITAALLIFAFICYKLNLL